MHGQHTMMVHDAGKQEGKLHAECTIELKYYITIHVSSHPCPPQRLYWSTCLGECPLFAYLAAAIATVSSYI